MSEDTKREPAPELTDKDLEAASGGKTWLPSAFKVEVGDLPAASESPESMTIEREGNEKPRP